MATKRTTSLAAASAMTGTALVEISQRSTTVRISAATISAAAADNSFNDSANGFLAAGFAVGDRVNVEGFTGNTANNILVGAVTDLTAGKMTIGGTDGDVIVDDAAGETVVISKWTSRRAVHSEFVAGGAPPVATVSGTTYDVLNTDKGKYIRFTNAAAKAATFRPNATHALDDNGEWHFRNVGAGTLSIAAGAGVTINLPSGGSLDVPQGGTVTVKRVAVNEFDLMGVTA